MPQPKVILPRFEIMTRSPIEGLTEVRTSLSSTLASIETALPAPALPTGGLGLLGPGGQANLGPPPFKQLALSIEELGPDFLPKLSQVAGQVEKTLGSGGEVKRGAIGAAKPAPSLGGVATRGSL